MRTKTNLSRRLPGFVFFAGALFGWVVLPTQAFAVCLDPPGDLDISGETTIADVQCSVLLTLWGLGISDTIPGCVKNNATNGDVDCSGNLTVADVQLVIAHTLGQPLNPAVDFNQDGCVDVCQDVVCGDGLCSPGENCDACVEDCNECPSTIYFNKDWTETLDGPIVAGKQLRIWYDPARLPTCRGSKYGFPAWSIVVYYSFDLSKGSQYVSVVGKSPDQWELVPQIATIDVPPDAENVWFWAQNTSAFGCVEWDSDFGKNYEFPAFKETTLKAPLSWVGNFQFVESSGSNLNFLGDKNPAWYAKSLANEGKTTWIQAEVWAAGVTDRIYANDAVTVEVAQTAIVAWMYSPFVGDGDGGGKWGITPLQFVGKVGNNFVYRWDPVPVVQSPSFKLGTYPYTLRFAGALSDQIWTLWSAQDEVPRYFEFTEQ